jgi:hypothetical protein
MCKMKNNIVVSKGVKQTENYIVVVSRFLSAYLNLPVTVVIIITPGLG